MKTIDKLKQMTEYNLDLTHQEFFDNGLILDDKTNKFMAVKKSDKRPVVKKPSFLK